MLRIQQLLRQREAIFAWFEQHSVRSMFCVVDPVVARLPLGVEFLQLLGRRVKVMRREQVRPNPEYSAAIDSAAAFLASDADCLLGWGGGSAIDLAKLSRCEPTWIEDLTAGLPVDADMAPDPRPMLAMPTTAGSGSEATPFAVVYRQEAKFSVAHPELLPHVAIVDPAWTYNMPGSLVAAAGLDALCQSIESMWSVRSTVASRSEALHALQTVWRHLGTSFESGTVESRDAMAWGAHCAGRAISVSQTTAAHALSYALTARWGVAHGIAVALFMPALIKWNAETPEDQVSDPRGPEHLRQVMQQIVDALGASSPDDAADHFTHLLRRLEAPVRLRDVGLDRRDVRWLAESVNAQRLQNNPRRIDIEQLPQWLEQIW
ncbi:MAG: phosphonoacetaldehyde reductase [Pirellulales bacterium]